MSLERRRGRARRGRLVKCPVRLAMRVAFAPGTYVAVWVMRRATRDAFPSPFEDDRDP